MTNIKFLTTIAIIFLLTGIFIAESSLAGENTVIEVRVEGNKRLAKDAVLSSVKTRCHQEYNQEIIQADEKRLLQTRKFSSVVVTATQTDQGIIVTFTVTERAIIKLISFRGNKKYSGADLAKELSFSVRDALYLPLLRHGRDAIASKYKSNGYYFVAVRFDETASAVSQEVTYNIVEGPRVSVRKIKFEGNKHFSNFRLKLNTSSAKRFWPIVPGYLKPDLVARDIQEIRRMYVEDGFLEAQVDRELTFSGDKSRATIRYIISEGQRFRLNKLIFRGNTVFSADTLAARLRLKRGNYVKADILKRDIKRLHNTYGELGYIESGVSVKRQYLPLDAPAPQWAQDLDDGDPALLNLVFTITESAKFSVGNVNIRGNSVTQDRIIRRQVRTQPGKDFNLLAMVESEKRLMETTLFEDVTIKPMGTDETVRDVLVRIVEGRTANFIVGIGANSNSGLVGNISFTQRNFDIMNTPKSASEFFTGQSFKGAGQKLTISAEPGMEMFRFNVDWFEPMLFDQPYSLDINAYLFSNSLESYDLTRLGAVTSIGHRFLNRWYGELTARVESANMGDLDDDAPPEVIADAGTYFMTSIRGTLVRDRTDSRWWPTTGDRFSVSYEQMAGTCNFGRASSSYRIYRTLYVDALDGKHVLAGRVRADMIVGDAPIFEKFYGGGIGSVRGFAFRGISPRSASPASDDPIGGDFRLLAGAEYSYPIIRDHLRGVFFLDTGTVSDSFSASQFRASVGFGIRLTVPFLGPVPMSLDFGFPISKQPGDETQIFSFSLGWQF